MQHQPSGRKHLFSHRARVACAARPAAFTARHGMARHGTARHGMARHGRWCTSALLRASLRARRTHRCVERVFVVSKGACRRSARRRSGSRSCCLPTVSGTRTSPLSRRRRGTCPWRRAASGEPRSFYGCTVAALFLFLKSTRSSGSCGSCVPLRCGLSVFLDAQAGYGEAVHVSAR